MFANADIMGRVGRDPDIKYFESGTVKCTLSLAVSSKFKKGEETQESTDWFDVEAWGKTAEIIANYVHKGDLICIEGTLQTQKWEDKNTGAKRSKVVVNARQVHLLPNKRDVDNRVNSEPTHANPDVGTGDGIGDDGDIPF